MLKSTLKIIALVLTFIMLISVTAFGAFAETDDTATALTTETEASSVEKDDAETEAATENDKKETDTKAVTSNTEKTTETADSHEGHDHGNSKVSNIIGIIVAIILPIAAIAAVILFIPKKNSSKKK